MIRPSKIAAVICGLSFIGMLLLPGLGHAQFMNMQLNVESKLTATTERPLDFGVIATNSGRQMIELGNTNMGIFSITALENQLLLLTLNKPDNLYHQNPVIEDVVPLQLFSRYGYSFQNSQDSEQLPETTSTITVEENPEIGPWNTFYIFMYGAIEIGNISEGDYTNEVTLNVEYI